MPSCCSRGRRKPAPDDGSAQVWLTLTREEVAEIIRTTSETVSRLFSEFKKKQLMQMKGRDDDDPQPPRWNKLASRKHAAGALREGFRE